MSTTTLPDLNIECRFFELEFGIHQENEHKFTNRSILKDIFGIIKQAYQDGKPMKIDRYKNQKTELTRYLMLYPPRFIPKTQRWHCKMTFDRRKYPKKLNNKFDTEDLDFNQNEPLVEETYFVIDVNQSKPLVLIEYNDIGPRMSDFIFMVRRYGDHLFKSLDFQPLLEKSLDELPKNMKAGYGLTIKPKANNYDILDDVDTHFTESFKATSKVADIDFEIKIRLARRKGNGPIVRATDTIKKVLYSFLDKPSKFNNVSLLKIDADIDGVKERTIDLLSYKLKKYVQVEQVSKGNPHKGLLYKGMNIVIDEYKAT